MSNFLVTLFLHLLLQRSAEIVLNCSSFQFPHRKARVINKETAQSHNKAQQKIQVSKGFSTGLVDKY